MTEQIKQIAQRLKALREIEEISVEQIANEFHIPVDTYKKYEAGEMDIPVSVLYEAANKFGVEMAAILSGGNPKLRLYSFDKAGKGMDIERRKEYKYQSLGQNFIGKKMEPMVVTVPFDGEDTPVSLNSHSGQEFNYVIEGQLTINLNGKCFDLEVGDSLYFDSSCPHGMKARGGKSAKFLAVIL